MSPLKTETTLREKKIGLVLGFLFLYVGLMSKKHKVHIYPRLSPQIRLLAKAITNVNLEIPYRKPPRTPIRKELAMFAQ